jgi:hypothetical protein
MDRQKVRTAIADAKRHLGYAVQLKDGEPVRAAIDAQIASASALVAIADMLFELLEVRQTDR